MICSCWDTKKDIKVSENKKLIIDPPSGWRYGFPKEVSMENWLLECGYPEKDLELAMKYGRSWYE